MLEKLREFFRNGKRRALVVAILVAALAYAGVPAPVADAIVGAVTRIVAGAPETSDGGPSVPVDQSERR